MSLCNCRDSNGKISTLKLTKRIAIGVIISVGMLLHVIDTI